MTVTADGSVLARHNLGILTLATRILALMSLLLACRGGDPRSKAPVRAGEAAPALSRAQLQGMADRLVGEVAGFRGIQGSGSLTVDALSGEEIRKRAEREIRRLCTQDELDLTRRVELSLGFRPPGPALDGPPGSISVPIAGMYDPLGKSLLIDGALEAEQLEWIMAHEVVHHLQDSSFDLAHLGAPIRGDSDAELARTLLTEGDAQAASFAWETRDRTLAATSPDRLRRQGEQALDSEGTFVYPVLGCIHMLPYNFAASTIVQVIRERGWTSVDALFRDPPATTEQMLHTTKLYSREPAISISARPGLLTRALANYAVLRQDTLGEAQIFCMLADVASSAVARTAASGWGGDRLVILERGSDHAAAPVVLGLIAWDRDSEAAEFEPVFRRYLEGKSSGQYLLQRRDVRVVFAMQVPPDDLAAVSEMMWAVFSPEQAI